MRVSQFVPLYSGPPCTMIVASNEKRIRPVFIAQTNVVDLRSKYRRIQAPGIWSESATPMWRAGGESELASVSRSHNKPASLAIQSGHFALCSGRLFNNVL